MSTPITKSSIKDTIRIYFFPGLVAILSTMIWRDVSEMRNDVKMLLAQSNIDKTKIENLEKDVRQIESTVYNKKLTSMTEVPLFIKFLFKHEEIFDVKKYLPKES